MVRVRPKNPRISPLALVGAVLTTALTLLPLACASNDPVGNGGACFVTTDCANGLVCIPQANGSRICSNDLSSIQKSESDGGEAGAGAAGGGGGGGAGGGTGDSGSAPPPTDSGGTGGDP